MFSQLSYLTSIPKMLGHSWMIFLATLFFTFQAPTLEAYGGGKTGEVLEYQGTKWNGVYFTTADDVKGVAVIPNSSGVSMTSSEGRTVISLRGSISKDIGYLIATS
ncbi:MAG: hypothetical protein ACXU9U_04150, partial [Parachlamydiaceae bacterium]